jgi:hypothetical protein
MLNQTDNERRLAIVLPADNTYDAHGSHWGERRSRRAHPAATI